MKKAEATALLYCILLQMLVKCNNSAASSVKPCQHNQGMVLKEQVEALGREVRRLRLVKGITTVTELHKRTNISRAFLSQIENAYEHPKRGLVIPTDSMLDRLAKELDVPVSRLHAILGRFPEQVRKFSAEAEGIAEDFDRLPPLGKKIVRDSVRTAREIAAELTVEPSPDRSGSET